MDEVINNFVEEKYPECKAPTAVPGVGNLTALAFVLTLGARNDFGGVERRGVSWE